MPPFAWSPSGDRTILLSDQAMAAPTGRLAAVLPLRWPDTPAGAQLDVSLDASALQASAADALTVVLNATTNVTAIAAPVIIGGLVSATLLTLLLLPRRAVDRQRRCRYRRSG